MNTRNKKYLLTLLFVFFLLPIIVGGQVESDNKSSSTSTKTSLNQTVSLISRNMIDIIINPQTPKSGDTLTASLAASGWDFNQAKITWYINNEKFASSYGLKKISFNLGKGIVKLSVEVEGSDGKKGAGEIKIKPNEVVVIWEADTYTPPFYKGKALAAMGTVFRVIAIPNIKDNNDIKISADKLIYKWRKNSEAAQSDSGYGKNVYYTVDQTYTRDSNDIDVEIYSTDNTSYFKTTVIVPHQNTGAFLYEVDPLLGRLYNKTLGGELNYSNSFVKLIAEPYFFSTPLMNNVQLGWIIDNKRIGFSGSILELKSENNDATNLKLEVKHNTKTLQNAETSIVLTPEQNTNLINNAF